MKNKELIINLIIHGIVLLTVLCTLFFSAFFEKLFKLYPDTSKIYNNSLTVHFVDVGQGDATLIKFPNNKTMLIDSGAASSKAKLFNYINNVFFCGSKNRTFDYVLLTHPDLDHAGNMLDVLQNYNVKNFIRPKILFKGLEFSNDLALYSTDNNYGNIISYLSVNNINTIYSDFNLKIEDGTYEYLHMLSPVKSYYSDENCFSPIISISYNNVKFLLTGDATQQNELEVINNYNNETLKANILKLGHHGSKSSTSYAFLEAVKPEYAVISVGKNNSYLHPSDEVINNISNFSQEYGSNLSNNTLQTQDVGNIIFSVNGYNKFEITKIKNVDDYVFVGWWAVILIIICLYIVCIIIPKIYKSLNKANKKIL